jgi:hypothetical protein
MAFVSDSHNTLFKNKIDILREDLGRDITIVEESNSTECSWCYYDDRTDRSSGKQKQDWTTHPNYDNVGLRCPHCKGLGRIPVNSSTTVEDVIIEDLSGLQMERGKYGFFPSGTKKLIGKLTDVLVNSEDVDSDDLLSTADKILIDGVDYRLVSINRLGLKDLYLFEAIVQRTDLIERD